MSNSQDDGGDFSLSDPYSSYAGLDEDTRRKKAAKIISILKNRTDLAACDLLDVGTGSGHIVALIAQECRSATSVNLEDERIVKDGYRFVQVEDVRLPFPDESFDVVVSNQVIEHIPPQQDHLNELHRVLKKGGIAYVATPSKYTLMEPHFKLPFLSWLPKPMADRYVRLFGHERFDIYPLSLGRLGKMCAGLFRVENMSVEVIKDPERYKLDMMPAVQPLLRRLPRGILALLQPLMPSFIVILHKPA
ncbi:MAG: class I SAM-dependent methyltransferase [Candidatus Omnitrophica bacterium]|nr:class I SAM-dependent methyltransferase [Candidatus Omnitrophota bacterium]MCB9721744.1 class I SAM-dependent methyltransferase [Candidatus Omnitrophota bacterium]